MDMKEDKDELLKRFFSTANQTVIADEGFSDRVMEAIEPAADKRLRRISRIWTAVCWTVGIVILIYIDLISSIHESATHVFWNCIRWMTDIMQQFDPEHINPLVFTLPLVATMVVAIWCLAENKKLSEI